MRALGVDLSTSPKKTWACLIETAGSEAQVVALGGGHDDESLIRLMVVADVVGIDCPLGWPTPFVQALSAHAEEQSWPGRARPEGPDAYRRTLLLRATDLAVKEATGINPLSVSANLLGATAMRCALLQDALIERGIRVDRTGATGRVVEVYPRAALQAWGLPGTGYKGSALAAQCAQLADRLVTRVEGLSIPASNVEALRRSDDALDAFVSALVALASRRVPQQPVPPGLAGRAATEGWIHIPDVTALRVRDA